MEVIPKEMQSPEYGFYKLGMLCLGFGLMSLLAIWAWLLVRHCATSMKGQICFTATSRYDASYACVARSNVMLNWPSILQTLPTIVWPLGEVLNKHLSIWLVKLPYCPSISYSWNVLPCKCAWKLKAWSWSTCCVKCIPGRSSAWKRLLGLSLGR